jgi:hypothetical protein
MLEERNSACFTSVFHAQVFLLVLFIQQHCWQVNSLEKSVAPVHILQKEASYTADPESLGDIGLFTADAERLNGRVAMLAMMFILTVETMTGAPLLY